MHSLLLDGAIRDRADTFIFIYYNHRDSYKRKTWKYLRNAVVHLF